MLDRSEEDNVKDAKATRLPPKDSATIVATTDKSLQEEIIGFYQVLEAIGKTTEELQDILRRENISLDSFLAFIDQGTTREKVREFLKVSSSSNKSTVSNGNLLSKTKYRNEAYETDRKKVLIDLPFTEIVHEIPVQRPKPIDDSGVHLYDKKTTNSNQPSPQTKEFHPPKKSRPKKWDKEVGETKEKSHKPKKNKKQIEGENPFLMNSDSHSSILPSKDSPIVLPFRPPKRKKPTTKHSASIIALTVEKGPTQMVSDSAPQLLPTRNKILSGKERKQIIHEKGTPSSYSASFDSNGRKHWDKKSSKNHFMHQSNLRMVFPMRGILMFCGILGAVAAVTILILIIYGAVKCNRKTSVDSYQMSECPSTTVTTS